MTNEFYNDGKFIFINTECAEAYIPDELFDSPTEDPSASSLAYDTGDMVVTIGVFYMRFFNTDEVTKELREKTKVRTLNYPNKIECKPSGTTTREMLTINGSTDRYRVLHFNKGDILMEATSKKSATNCEMFTKLVMAGKMPKSLSYNDLYFSWKKNFDINDVNPSIPSVLMQAIIAKMCRNPENTGQQFRFIAGSQKVDPHAYVMLNMNQVSAYSSVMSSMTFERFAEKLTTSLVMTKDGTPQEKSPIESVLMM